MIIFYSSMYIYIYTGSHIILRKVTNYIMTRQSLKTILIQILGSVAFFLFNYLMILVKGISIYLIKDEMG